MFTISTGAGGAGFLPSTVQHYCQTIQNSLSPTGINVLVQNRRVLVVLVLRGQHMSTTRGVLCCASHSMLAGRACGKFFFLREVSEHDYD